MTKEYSCPNCASDVTVGENESFVHCPACKTLLEVNCDAEFRNGSWHDLTTLTPINLNPVPVLAEPRDTKSNDKITRQTTKIGEVREAQSRTAPQQDDGEVSSRGGVQDSLPGEKCAHLYTERVAAPLGVSCTRCGKFIGACET